MVVSTLEHDQELNYSALGMPRNRDYGSDLFR